MQCFASCALYQVEEIEFRVVSFWVPNLHQRFFYAILTTEQLL